VTCSAGTDLSESITPGPGSRYYLVAATAGTTEGMLGITSDGTLRPPSTLACGVRETTSCEVPGSGEDYTGESPFPHFDQP
ncbi:MAG: hypothetical protein R3344_05895, partial [Acidobacteriota bacterium]|nr:hypothetical protein [Acidobacteriota bacterium]